MPGFKKAFEEIKELSRKFEEQYIYFTDPLYTESAVRKDFIDRFFSALGWDINHLHQQNPYLQQVRIANLQNEQPSGGQKTADYAFYLQPDFKNPKFYVEAKKPSGDLGTRDNYFQTIRYGWNAGTKISVLTDFRELHILDCRQEPDIGNVSDAHHIKFEFTQYPVEEIFKKIYGILSYTAVLTGQFDTYIESMSKRGVRKKNLSFASGCCGGSNESLLQYINKMGEKLAMLFRENIATLNPQSIQNNIQRTIDRLVFLRFLEDRMIETSFSVSNFGSSKSAWKDFIGDSKTLEAKYIDTIFKKHPIDGIVLGQDGEELFQKICNEFSSLNSIFLFNHIPVSALGSIYEEAIGKIKPSEANSSRPKEKRGARKAGGVYYTPKFIIDFILDHTVGKLIAGKSPGEIAKLKIADIACGCGSFLIGITERLFDYHIKYYNEHPQDAENANCHQINGGFILTSCQKQKIVLNNIYGVDIDPGAVGISLLSLFLMIMEEEPITGVINRDFPPPDKILSDLSKNIICGNSLTGSAGNKTSAGHMENSKMHNSLNFDGVFPKLQESGFDIIVGNPPYGAAITKEDRKYLLRKYPYGNSDTAALFMLRADQLVRKGGLAGFIIPKAFTYASNWKKTRDYLLADLSKIADCSKVWKEVKLEMCISISEKASNSGDLDSYARNKNRFEIKGKISKENCRGYDFIFNAISETEIRIANRMRSSGKVLNDFVTNRRGGMFQKQIRKKGEYKVIGGKQLKRYGLIKAVKGYADKADLKEEKCFILNGSILVQNIVAHIQHPVPHIAIIATLPGKTSNLAILDTVNQLINCSHLNSHCILGILNSKLISWYTHKFIFANAIRTMHFDSNTTKKIPFPDFNLENKDHRSLHDKIAELVKQRLEIDFAISNIKAKANKPYFENKKSGIENSIDKLVAVLFGFKPLELSFLSALEYNIVT